MNLHVSASFSVLIPSIFIVGVKNGSTESIHKSFVELAFNDLIFKDASNDAVSQTFRINLAATNIFHFYFTFPYVILFTRQECRFIIVVCLQAQIPNINKLFYIQWSQTFPCVNNSIINLKVSISWWFSIENILKLTNQLYFRLRFLSFLNDNLISFLNNLSSFIILIDPPPLFPFLFELLFDNLNPLKIRQRLITKVWHFVILLLLSTIFFLLYMIFDIELQ